MPLLRTETGWRCKNTLVSMTTTRLRRSRGAGWRKMLFQTCELRIKSPMAISIPYRSQKNVRIRIVPLADLALELARLVHDDLAFLGAANSVTLKRPRRGALEVDAGH